MNTTIAYYNQNARDFHSGTVNADMSDAYSRFLPYVPKGASILDLGCGSGRDSRVFAEMGYQVTAVDGSEEICKLASEYLGVEVECLLFEDLQYDREFDAIWACASLLHVSKDDMPAIIAKVRAALKPDGILYASYKYGTEERNQEGRAFSDYTEDDVASGKIFGDGLTVLETWVSEDVRPDRCEKWLNIICQRQG